MLVETYWFSSGLASMEVKEAVIATIQNIETDVKVLSLEGQDNFKE